MRDFSINRVTLNQSLPKGGYNEPIFSPDELHPILASYFDGSISPADMQLLKEASAAFAQSKLQIADPQIAADLKCIAALEEYSEAALQAWEQNFPSDLESRLDKHISSLATRSRRRAIWLKVGSAAACAALLLTAASYIFHALSPQPAEKSESDLVPLAVAEDVIVSPKVAEHSEQTTEPATLISTPTPPATTAYAFPTTASAFAGSANADPCKSQSPCPPERRKHQSNDIVLPYQLADAKVPMTAAAVILPETLAPKPSAYEMRRNDLAGLILHPFDAISNTFDDIKQSLDFVNATIYDANKTAGSLSEEFLQASAAPFRSI